MAHRGRRGAVCLELAQGQSPPHRRRPVETVSSAGIPSPECRCYRHPTSCVGQCTHCLELRTD
eukprot:10087616-Lingulodinium_polyedra.AAC.1